MRVIDLNCDLGEGCGNDAELMKYISSANIACGRHAGDRDTMRKTAELAAEYGVAIGAHPGYDDRENFGRTAMLLPSGDIFNLVVEQILDLDDICRDFGLRLCHVKPHGALYNQAAVNRELAAVIAEAVKSVSPDLILFGLSESFLVSEAERAGLRAAAEVFSDRTYMPDGTLAPRTRPDALIHDPEASSEQAVRFAMGDPIEAVDGTQLSLRADTICIHGDGDNAVAFARSIKERLEAAGVSVTPLK
jgi:5-oxoprolinase (ATP-hydrolysing) subunit A